jgi:hypothetical protein
MYVCKVQSVEPGCGERKREEVEVEKKKNGRMGGRMMFSVVRALSVDTSLSRPSWD